MSKKIETRISMRATKKLVKDVEKALAQEYGDPNKSLDEILKEQEEKEPYLVFGMPVKEYERQVEEKRKEIQKNENTRQP